MIHGFDVSRWQAGLDMGAAAEAGMKFVYVRASTGAAVDLACREHLHGAYELMLRGTYHALQPRIPGRVQARAFYRSLAQSGGFFTELPPALDVEKAGIDATVVREFLAEMASIWDRQPIIYTSRSKWHSLIGKDQEWAAEYPLWVAHWDVMQPRLPTPWTDWTFWQHGVGHVAFWEKRIDLDAFNGTEDDLWELAYGDRQQ